ncbi:MAG TPA: serine/threonine-protein kinase [Kofleriaceae bacterium]|nr:serine/threonine-protein kinase [Kofleriaceae bacterium]
MIGQVLGSYRIVAELGKGGMGVVYRGEHVQLGRPAAIKVLLPQMSSDPQIVQRFFNEARAASSIEHPGIVEIYDYGHEGGRAYIVMALLRGESLDHRLMRPMAPLEAASLIAQVASALAAAHARGIVHRDLKPDNIYLVPNELVPGGIQVKLLDFGIAKLADDGASGYRTQTGVLIGTPAYMSPEQCMGRADVDHRTDLYAVGCILFHMLCGRPPFLSDQGTGVMIAMHLRDPVPDPRAIAPHLPEPLVAIMLRLLEKDPAARFQSAHELRQALVAAGAIAPMTAPGAAPDAYGATMASGAPPSLAPTTHTAAAAELVTRPERLPHRGGPGAAPAGGGKRGIWMALGALLLVGGGVVAIVAATSDGGAGGGGAGTGPGPGSGSGSEGLAAIPTPGSGSEAKPIGRPPEPPPEPPPVPVPPPEPPPVPPHDLTVAQSPCPPGQLRSEDTRGHCCWPGQAWSTAKQRCIGTPACPPGTRRRGEQCVDVPEQPNRPQDPDQPPGITPRSGQRFSLASRKVPAGGKVSLRFPGPLRAAPNERFWVTVIEAGTPDDRWGQWDYVTDGARTFSLGVPDKPGAYEVRLHANYPKQTTNVVHRAAIRVE